MGANLSDLAIIPVASAQSLFDTTSLFRILVQAKGRESIPKAEKAVINTIRDRHDGEDDVTVVTQDAMLSTFDQIFQALTLTVAGIAAISLAVAGILIMNVMLVSVSQRTAEIGLLKALGSPGAQVQRLFLVEAALLSLSGALIGIAVAFAGVWGLEQLFPDFPLSIPVWAFVAAILVSLATGLIFGVLPARRAAALDPVLALAGR
jgi:putative ABC transport system permease protein